VGRQYANFVGIIAPAVILMLSWPLTAKGQPHGQGGNVRVMPQPHRPPGFSDPRQRFMAMPPQDRQIFQRNAERWMQMGPDERKIMRVRERIYREQVSKEVDAAIRQSGLRLEGEKRALFEQRYLQERRRMEHSLRQEIENQRQRELPALQERLKKEFAEPAPPVSSSTAPPSSGSPRN